MSRRRRILRILKWSGGACCLVLLVAWPVSWTGSLGCVSNVGGFGFDEVSVVFLFGREESRFGLIWESYSSSDWWGKFDFSAWPYYTIAIPIWFALSVCVVVTAVLLRLDRKRVIPGRCQSCGSDLTDHAGGVCPECAEDMPLAGSVDHNSMEVEHRLTIKRPRRKVKLAICFACLALLVWTGFGVLHFIADFRWDRHVEMLLKRDEPYFLPDIIESRPDVDPRANGATVIESAAERLRAVSTEKLERVFDRLKPFHDFTPKYWSDVSLGLPRGSVDQTAEFLSEHRALVDELLVLSSLPIGLCSIDMDTNAWIGFPADALRAGRILRLQALQQISIGELGEASSTILAQLNTGETLSSYPTLIGRAVQASVQESAVQSIQDLLWAGLLLGPSLTTLQTSIEEALKDDATRFAILGERAIMAARTEGFVRDEMDEERLHTRLSRRSYRRCQLLASGFYTDLLDANGSTLEMLAVLNAFGKHVTETLDEVELSFLWDSYWFFSIRRHGNALAKLQSARVGLAAERYRIDVGEWPSSIDVLVPDYLERVPADPYRDEPLRMTRSDGHLVVYSVGINKTDDGGRVWVKHLTRDPGSDTPGFEMTQNARPEDIGFRLRSPEDRNLPLIDDPPLPEPLDLSSNPWLKGLIDGGK